MPAAALHSASELRGAVFLAGAAGPTWLLPRIICKPVCSFSDRGGGLFPVVDLWTRAERTPKHRCGLGWAIWRERQLFLLFADIDLLFLAKFSGAFHAHNQARSIIGKDIEAGCWPPPGPTNSFSFRRRST